MPPEFTPCPQDPQHATLDAALDYARRGWPVFPCIGKVPAIERGFHAATANPASISRLWRQGDLNIGIPTGAASGFWCLDIDGAEGNASLEALEATHGKLPATLTSITGGGWHLLFGYTGPVQSSASRVGPHLDVRGDGGYIIVAPSRHPNGRIYEWLEPSAPLAIAPPWLIELTRKRPSISEQALARITRPHGAPGAYGRVALEREITALSAAPNGTRNNALNLCGFRLFQLVGGGELDGDLVVDRLVAACITNGLVTDDGLPSVMETIRSAMAGTRCPRSRSSQ